MERAKELGEEGVAYQARRKKMQAQLIRACLMEHRFLWLCLFECNF